MITEPEEEMRIKSDERNDNMFENFRFGNSPETTDSLAVRKLAAIVE